MKKLYIIVALLVSFMSFSSHAALVRLQVEGGGIAQVFQLSDGSFLGLMGFDNRGSNTADVTINTFEDLVAGFTSGNVVAFFNGTNPVNVNAQEFDALIFGFTVEAGARLFDSLWVQWTGGNLVHSFQGRTVTMGTNITRIGDPLSASTVDVPAPHVLMISLLALLGMGMMRQKKHF